MTPRTTAALAAPFGLGLLALLAGCRHADAPEKEKERPPVQVRTAKAEKRTLEPTFEVIGTVQGDPERSAVLSAATPGLVDKLAAAEGTKVGKGQLVVHLDDAKAKTDLEKAEAVYARLVAKPRPDELVAARSAVAKGKAALGVAKAQLDKSNETSKANPALVTDVQRLEYERAAAAAAADVDDAEAAYRLLELGPKEELRREARADLTAAKLQLDYCRVTTPIDGELVELIARAGTKADVGTPLARVVDSSVVLVQARVPGDRLAAVAAVIAAGGKEPLAVVRTAAVPGETFPASGGWLGQQTEAATGDVPVRLRVPNPKGLLRVGMTVRVELREPPAEGIAVPEAAVTVNEEGHHVVTVVKDGKANPVEIEIEDEHTPEVRADGWVRVLKGLEEGDEVAVENGYALPENTPVEVLPPKAEKELEEKEPKDDKSKDHKSEKDDKPKEKDEKH